MPHLIPISCMTFSTVYRRSPHRPRHARPWRSACGHIRSPCDRTLRQPCSKALVLSGALGVKARSNKKTAAYQQRQESHEAGTPALRVRLRSVLFPVRSCFSTLRAANFFRYAFSVSSFRTCSSSSCSRVLETWLTGNPFGLPRRLGSSSSAPPFRYFRHIPH